jgi:hypothetical protein
MVRGELNMDTLPNWIIESPEFQKLVDGGYSSLADALWDLDARLRRQAGLAESFRISAARGELVLDIPPRYTEPAPYGL